MPSRTPCLEPSPGLSQAILESVSDGVFSVDRGWRITSFNPAAEKILGVSAEAALGRPCREILNADACSGTCPLRYTLETGSQVINYAVRLTRADGRTLPAAISTALLRDAKGAVIGGVESFRDLSTLESLRNQLRDSFSFHDIVSKNPRMKRLFEILPTVAASDSTVLIEGESGTGKGLLARALHSLSSRRHRPLITISCGAIPEALMESELFGYKAGAFTGAARDKPGRIHAADKGTVFFDEIGEAPPSIQVKLLRVLEDGELERLGDVRTTRVDIRVLAATNHDLAADVDRGQFRADLFFRLNVMRLHLPPLRERMDDVSLLVDHFLRRHAARLGKHISGVSPEAMAALMTSSYPGNIREFQNVIEHSCVLCPQGEIAVEHLPVQLQPLVPGGDSLQAQLSNVEAEMIHQALVRHRWSRAAAARELRIHRSTLLKKMKILGITSPPTDGRSRVSQENDGPARSG